MLIAIIVLIGLSLLILGHEAGHFFAAKIFGLRVDEFGFGFPPRIKAWKKGETEYSINWLPFGGFVRIAGERGEMEMINPEKGAEGAVRAGGEPGVYDAAITPAETAAAHLEAEDESRLLNNQPAWKKSIIMLAGVFVNLIIGWVFLSLILMIGAPQALIISSVEPGSPAAAAGIQANDIVSGYKTAQPFIDYINNHRGESVMISVVRNDKQMSFNLTPRKATGPNEGAIGVGLSEAGTASEGFFSAIRDGLISAGIIAWLVLLTLFQLVGQIFAHGTLLAGVVGPVGIFGVAEETGKIGLVYLLQLLGVISVNLAVVNLIPFPALDGGRFLVAIVEKIKGSPMPYKIEAWINGLGFAVLLGLMVLLTVRDIGALI